MNFRKDLAPQVGLEPTTLRLTAQICATRQPTANNSAQKTKGFIACFVV
jgi:hypothetical protein